MDALQKLLQSQYGLSAKEAASSAARIHAEHSNEDNLQTEAYDPVAKGEVERMDRLRKNALLFTDIAKRRAAGEKLKPEHQSYYDNVMKLHQENVAQRLRARQEQDRAMQQRAGGSGGSRPFGGTPINNTVRGMAGTQGIVNTQVAPVLGPGSYQPTGGQMANQPGGYPTANRDAYLQPGSDMVEPQGEQLADLYQNQYPVNMPAMPARRK
jgi:hypothetical protein